jgi:hypothetical protein
LTRGTKRKEKPAEGASVRATISFPSELYKTLEGIAGSSTICILQLEMLRASLKAAL